MKKYYNFETMFYSLKNGLATFLKKSGIRYELSACGTGWHKEVEKVNTWLDENTMTEA